MILIWGLKVTYRIILKLTKMGSIRNPSDHLKFKVLLARGPKYYRTGYNRSTLIKWL